MNHHTQYLKHHKILCFLELIPTFNFHLKSSLHYPKYVAALFLDQLGWQYVSRNELDPSSTELLAATP